MNFQALSRVYNLNLKAWVALCRLAGRDWGKGGRIWSRVREQQVLRLRGNAASAQDDKEQLSVGGCQLSVKSKDPHKQLRLVWGTQF
jgi:hypothetical protein